MTALEKAKGALEQARSLLEEHGADMPPMVGRQYIELLGIAGTQANIAQAEALQQIADGHQRLADSVVVATCRLAGVVPTTDVCFDGTDGSDWMLVASGRVSVHSQDGNRALGDFSPGRFAWLLSHIEPVDPPVPARGRQQLWEWAA